MNKKKTILIVDDTETNIDILLELLSDEYDILVSLSGNNALEILQDEKIDLILLDIMMPNMNGYEVCTILKDNEITKNIPVIFITAKTDEDSIEKAYEVGGMDYIVKPFKPRELKARVKTQLHLRDLIEHLEFIASYDEMTGIYNRRKFFNSAIKKFNNDRKNLYAVMIDIDKFKLVNDTYGHAVGDKVIKIIAETISQNISEDSILGRIGGEEFAILGNFISKEEVIKQMEEIREEIDKLEVVTDTSLVVKFTISEGISKATDEMKDVDELLKIADKALYSAKGTGRNKVIFR